MEIDDVPEEGIFCQSPPFTPFFKAILKSTLKNAETTKFVNIQKKFMPIFSKILTGFFFFQFCQEENFVSQYLINTYVQALKKYPK